MYSYTTLIIIFRCFLLSQVNAYPLQAWPVYPQIPGGYADEDYYNYSPKMQYYYDNPALPVPEVYGQMPYSPYSYESDNHFAHEAQNKYDERLAALPIGQETWFENEAASRWHPKEDDDIKAAFLDNLILTQMAQDAQRRRENARALFPSINYDEKDAEDENVKELKALVEKPLHHLPKSAPRMDEDDYFLDDGFINWNGNKRSSLTTAAPNPTTTKLNFGQKEVMSGILQNLSSGGHHGKHDTRNPNFYDTMTQILANKSKSAHIQEPAEERRIEKRFVASDRDLERELRGLKHRIRT